MRMHWEDGFYCTYCGKEFGDQPDKLALHIRDVHEKVVESINNFVTIACFLN